MWHSLGLLCGIVLFCFLPKAASLNSLIGLSFLAGIAILLCRYKQGMRLFLLNVCLGFLLASWHYQQYAREYFPGTLQAKTLAVIGYVDGMQKQENDAYRFAFQIKKYMGQYHHFHQQSRVLLYWRDPPFQIRQGMLLQLRISLKWPHGAIDPGSFDRRTFAFANGLSAQGYVKSGRCLPEASRQQHTYFLFQAISRLRKQFKRKLMALTHGDSLQGFLLALAVGDHSLISHQQWQVFQKTGTSHLVAISGLHVSMVAGMVLLLIGYVTRFFPWIYLYCPRQCIGILPALCVAVGYGLFTGFAITTWRACLMLTILLSMRLMKRTMAAADSMTTSLYVILLLDPFAILKISFWLSFYAVLLLSAYLQVATTVYQKLKNNLIWMVAFMPLLLFCFGQIACLSGVANLVAIPIIACIVLPLLIVSFFFFILHLPYLAVLLSIICNILHAQWLYLHLLSDLPFAVYVHPVMHLWQVGLALFGAFLICYNVYPIWRTLGVLCFFPLLFWHLAVPRMHQLRVSVLDVGQGLSVVLQTAHHIMIYDTGPKYGANYNAGKAIIIPYLKELGVHKIDLLMVSHRDMDHIGGSNALLHAFPVSKILTSVPGRFLGWPVATCLRGLHWHWDGVTFRVLYPEKKDLHQDNNSSCVLHVQIGKLSVLLPGDIERQAELRIIDLHKREELNSTILIAPHHGSKTSSTQRFLQVVHPHIVVYSTGYLNHFHFPNIRVVARYHTLGVKQFDTQKTGAIVFTLNRQRILSIMLMNQQYHFPWDRE